ncbi:MAG TPA: SAM-dependent methyltransferase, partial [Hyphomicrobiaceae bacterium]|nr:SAM-dependent methyltransferase [Hyphomicrobiaceae bacterium]
WEFYLAASEAAFRHQNLVVFQVQLAKRVNALPITRDYIFKTERGIIEHESAERPRMAGE